MHTTYYITLHTTTISTSLTYLMVTTNMTWEGCFLATPVDKKLLYIPQGIKSIWQRRGRLSDSGLKTLLSLRACSTWKPQPKSLTMWRNFSSTWPVNSFGRPSRTSLTTMTLPRCLERVKPSVIWVAAASFSDLLLWWLSRIDCKGEMAVPPMPPSPSDGITVAP